MFGNNAVVNVVAPTGMDAFNVLGETLHRFAGSDWKNMKKEMMKMTQETYQKGLFIHMPHISKHTMHTMRKCYAELSQNTIHWQ
jgi:hypothetical protein